MLHVCEDGLIVTAPPSRDVRACQSRWGMTGLAASQAVDIAARDLAGAVPCGGGLEIVWMPRLRSGGCCGTDPGVNAALAAEDAPGTEGGPSAVGSSSEFITFDRWPDRGRRSVFLVPLQPVDEESAAATAPATPVLRACEARSAALVAAARRLCREATAGRRIPGLGAAATALQAERAVRELRVGGRGGTGAAAAAAAVSRPGEEDEEAGGAAGPWREAVVAALRAAEAVAAASGADAAVPAGEAVSLESAVAAADEAADSAAPPRLVLVVLSGASGSGQGIARWRTEWRPVLEAGGWRFDERQTERADHTTDIVRDAADPSLHWCVVLVGGDGILHEALQGVLARPDWRRVRLLPLVPLPAGSGNAVASAVASMGHESSNGRSPALTALHGRPIPLDASSVVFDGDASAPALLDAPAGTPLAAAIARVEATSGHAAAADDDSLASPAMAAAAAPAGSWHSSPAQHRRFMVLAAEWALPADLDVESEGLRCMGPNRFLVMAAVRAMCLRRYQGRVSFVRANGPGLAALADAASKPLASGDDDVPCGPAWLEDEQASAEAGDAAEAAAEAAEEATGETGRVGPLLRFFAGSGGEAAGAGAGAAKSGSSSSSSSSGWEHFDGEWTYLWSMQLPHQSFDVAGVPFSRPGDGVMWLSFMRGREAVGSCGMTAALLDLDGKGSAMRHRCMELVPVTAFRLEPETPTSWTPHIAMDGEDVPYKAFHCEMHRGLVRTLAK